ncbi:hypothetical protein FB480_105193 [Agrobacterium vitis]|nr:hypothetical protein FB480_105193 [Agrobacterium vitis]
MAALRAPRISDAGITARYGEQFAVDVAPFLDALKSSIGPRHFLGWLEDRGQSMRTVIELISGKSRDAQAPRAVELLSQTLLQFYEETAVAGHFAHSTMRERCRHVCHLFADLGNLPSGKYPSIDPDFFSAPYYADKPSESLADLKWPEFAGLPPARRERVGLDLIAAQSLSTFNELFRTFSFGQALAETEIEPDSPSWLIQRVLHKEQASWRTHGRPAKWDADHRRLVDPVLRTETWEMAGLSLPFSKSILDPYELTMLVLRCLGSTILMTDCVTSLFCCETGWNRQTIWSLRRRPTIFQGAGSIKLCNEEFLSEFKARAGSNVLAHLERDKPILGMVADEFNSAWRATSELKLFKDQDGYSVLDPSTSLLDVLDQYQQATEFPQSLPSASIASKRFFVALGRRGIGVPKRELGYEFKTGPISRPGCSFRTIRKSRLNLIIRDTDALPEIAAAGGHVNPRTTQRFYYTLDTLIHKLRPIRAFQDSLQALLYLESGVLKANIDPKQCDMLSKFARYSGIASACGLSTSGSRDPDLPDIWFDPTPERLEELYLAYRALKAARVRVSEARWKAQAVPQLGVVGGIIKALYRVGLGKLYFVATRRAIKRLAEGSAVLPPVLEI